MVTEPDKEQGTHEPTSLTSKLNIFIMTFDESTIKISKGEHSSYINIMFRLELSQIPTKIHAY